MRYGVIFVHMVRAGCGCITAFVALAAQAQSGLSVFRADTVHEIRITIDRPDWFQTMVDWHDMQQDSAQLVSMSFDGQVLDSVGMHMRGHFSYYSAWYKKPFKLDMNAFVGGQSFDGLRSLCLNNDVIDRSHLHSTLAFMLLNEFGVEAPRTGFANLFINDSLYGLYTLVEQVNKSFVGERFGNNDGDLWKSYLCAWNYVGPDPAFYANQMELKEAYDSAAFSRLIHVFELLATTPNALLDDSLDAVMDMESFLKTWAVNAAIVSEDNGMHNWWLYWNPDNGRYSYIPWDYDLSFFNVTPASFSEDTLGQFWWGSTQLARAVLRNPELTDRYYTYLCDFRTGHYRTEYLAGFIDSAYALLRPFVLNDNTFDNCPIAVYDSAYYALNTQQLLSQWGLHALIAGQGALLDSTLQAHQVPCWNVSVQEGNAAAGLAVFPNPSEGLFQVVNPGPVVCALHVRDTFGRTVLRTELSGNSTTVLDLRNERAGLFFLQANVGGVLTTTTVVLAP